MKEKQQTEKQSFKILALIIVLSLVIQAIGITVNAQVFDWAKGMGGSSSDLGFGVITDSSGNVYATGFFQSDTADFNSNGSGGTLVNTTKNPDVFLAKYDANGNLLWAKDIGGNGTDEGINVALDGSGNVYVIGAFNSDTVDFNPGGNGGTLTSAGGYDVFLAKYDAAGDFIWAKDMGGKGWDQGREVVADSNGDVYVTGYFGVSSPQADFNPGGSGGTLTSAGNGDAFLAKYNAAGNFLWAKGLGGKGGDEGDGIALDGSGNVYVTGYFLATADFNPGGSNGTLTAAGSYDGFLAKYDASGSLLWAKAMGGKSSDYSNGVSVDGSGNVYLTGYFQSDTADFNPGGSNGSLITAGGTDGFLSKYDAAGNFLWAEAMGGKKSDYSYKVVAGSNGNVYLTGYFQSDTVNFNRGGGGILITAGNYDAILAKYDASGSFLWAKAMGGKKPDQGKGITTYGRGNVVYMIGNFQSDMADFNPDGGGGILNTTGNNDVFLVKFGCDTSSSHLSVSTCEASYTLNDSTYTASGIYKQVFSNTFGCDSTVTLDLTITPITKPFINIDSFTLGVTGTYATYQWLKDDVVIPGATDSIYEVKENGNYRVVVSNEEGCSDTSDAYTVNNYTGIEDVSVLVNQIRLYPNPAADMINIQSPVKVDVILTDTEGRIIQKIKDAHGVILKGLAPGLYLLRIIDQNNHLIKVKKVIRQLQ